MISSRIRINTNIKYRFPENAKATATESAQRNHSALSRAFAAQRLELFEQPSSSKDLRLTALDKLEQRGFKPALGGIEIPLTGKAMGGMRRRVNAPFSLSSLSKEGAQQYRQEFEQELNEINDRMEHKELFIEELTTYLARPDLTGVQRNSARESLAEIRRDLEKLELRKDRLEETLRQSERGRWQSVLAESSHAGSQRGGAQHLPESQQHPGSYSGSRRG
jgi:hypothetical protein